MTFEGILVPISIVVCLWTLLPLCRHDAWWIRLFDFPRVQIAVISICLLSLYAAYVGWESLLNKLIILALLGCTIFQLMRIARYTSVFLKQVKTSQSLSELNRISILVANVLMTNRDSDALINLIQTCNPDVVLTLETDVWWEKQLEELESTYLNTVKHPLDNLYGMHLYSKLKLEDSQVLFLVEDDVPSIHTKLYLQSGKVVDLKCLHPAPPSPTENTRSLERDAELLIVAKDLGSKDDTSIVMGDLNDVAWSATTRMFQRISKLLDPRIGRGMFNTFHAAYPFLRWPLDHVFCSRDFTVVSLKRLGNIGSDHFPIHVVLSHEPAMESEHEFLKHEPSDHAVANEKIEEAMTA